MTLRSISAALATIVLVAALGEWLGSRLNPLAVGGGVFGPPAIPDFVGRDQEGNAISAASLRGHTVIANFIFTRCQGVCPTLTNHMVELQRALPVSLRFVSFSLDPICDTPAVLNDYSRRWKGDPVRWRLVALEPGTLSSMIAAVEDAEPHAPVREDEAHTTRFVLVDARGLIRGTYAGEDPLAIRRLAADAVAVQR